MSLVHWTGKTADAMTHKPEDLPAHGEHSLHGSLEFGWVYFGCKKTVCCRMSRKQTVCFLENSQGRSPDRPQVK